MRVYELVGNVKYGGGLAIVAANNRQQAHKVLRKEESQWRVDEYGFTSVDITCIRGMTMKCNTPRVISNFTWIE